MDIQNVKPTEINLQARPPKSGAEVEHGHTFRETPSVQPTAVNLSAIQNTATQAADCTGLTIDGYRILSPLAVDSGEADLYLCQSADGVQYCLKHYKRVDRIDETIRRVLQQIDTPYIARLHSWGYWAERVYEIWPYFSHGSLAEQHPDEQTLSRYIDQMNQALHALHQRGIIHQDIKPSNFMLDDRGDLALIDFGTSGMMTGEVDQRTHVTVLGRTSRYAACEVRHGEYCWPASDYYSMGVSIYELYFGMTPSDHYPPEMGEMQLSDQFVTRIPLLAQAPQRLRELLMGLLMYDKRERWGFAQVASWLTGTHTRYMQTPNYLQIRATNEGKTGKAFPFQKKVFYVPAQMDELVWEMATHWDMGKSLLDGEGRFVLMCKKLEDVEGAEELYAICNAAADPREGGDVHFFKKLYQLSPHLRSFVWKDWQFRDPKALGIAMLEALWVDEVQRDLRMAARKDTGTAEMRRVLSYDEMTFWARHHIISQYLCLIGQQRLADAVKPQEERAVQERVGLFRIGYLLSEAVVLRLPSRTYEGKLAFLEAMTEKARQSAAQDGGDSFLRFCKSEFYEGSEIRQSFKAWIEQLGFQEALENLEGINRP